MMATQGAALKTDVGPRAGDTIDGRFVVERILGGGRRRGVAAASGVLVRAWDRAARATVALRLSSRDADPRAFGLRAEARATFVHPALAKFVTFGATAPTFVATEWVEGEDLGRLSRKTALTLPSALAVVRRIADAVLVMNRRGAAHGAVSLEHVIVPGGDLERAKLVGLERALFTDRRTARAVEDVQEDVYGLSLLLYGALGGEMTPGSPRVAPLRRVRADLPAVLDELFARALSSDASRRPEDVAGLLAELEAVELVARGGKEDGVRAEASRLVTVVAAHASGLSALRMAELRELAVSAGGEIEASGDGTLVVAFPDQMDIVTVGAPSTATPAAASRGARAAAERAARCAIGLRSFEPAMAIVTSTACVSDVAANGGGAVARARTALAGAISGVVTLDDVTARLVEGRFETHADLEGIRLHRERERGSEPPPVLRGTPFVGRERENGILDATLTECIDERVARAVVIHGDAGIGKTRLVQEFVKRVRARGAPCEVWRAQGDPRRAASPLGIVGQLVRASAGVVEGEAARAREIKLRARASRHVLADHVSWVAEGLAELAGTEGAGRVDLADAWSTYASAEALVHPLVIVIEDTQWADDSSLAMIERLIAQVKNVPLMIVVTERDEAGTEARAWEKSNAATHVTLGELSRRAMEKLVTHLVGEGAPSARVGALVDDATGNPRTLIDAVRDGDTGRPHGQSHLAHRLARLSESAHRLLARGSVFGLTFWPGIAARMAPSSSSRLVAAHALDELVREELVHEASRARFPGEPEFVFRDADLLEIAYAALSEDERAQAHGEAARWLEEAGDRDARFLADQYRAAGNLDRADALLAQAERRAARVQK